MLRNSQVRLARGPPRGSSEWWSRVIGFGAAGYTLFKFKGLKLVLPVLKVAKMGPVLSMLLSMGAYGAVFGWKFGVGMVSLIFVHELGHALMMRRLNVPTGPMTFVPFMGAAVEMRGHPTDAYDESLIALAGPVVGTLASIPLTVYGMSAGSQFAFALAHWGYMVNLFNLMPVGSLDGGRVAGALSKWTLPAGLALCGGYIWSVWPAANPLLYLVFLGGCYTTYQRFYGYNYKPFGYYNLTSGQRTAASTLYFGLIGSLCALMAYNDKYRRSPQQLQRDLGLHLSKSGYADTLFDWAGPEEGWLSDGQGGRAYRSSASRRHVIIERRNPDGSITREERWY